MKVNSKLIVCISLILLFQNISTQELSLKEYLENINTIKADFIQTNYSVSNAMINQSNGRIKIKKPHHLIWDIKQPFVKKIILHQDKLSIFDSQLNQLLISSLPIEAYDSFLILLLRNASILNFYSIEKIDTDDSEVLFSLISNTRGNSFERINISILNGILNKLTFVDSKNESLEIKLINALINTNLSNNEFVFNPPKNTEIIDQSND
ncbi:MAG: outer membrane lipoprotein chaperone LolA [Gammaproteobacteria bacterium]|jgi:outer membrane lipoprotein carrier protein|nr:outer membrane lipoprotein chaperone LolA [Gammaproteobacteria bacterium]